MSYPTASYKDNLRTDRKDYRDRIKPHLGTIIVATILIIWLICLNVEAKRNSFDRLDEEGGSVNKVETLTIKK